jgi:L-seryl-tRNA(Ser) seleniumtransferase
MDIYEELGITPFINAYRPLTRLGGAVLSERVLEAMREASRKSVDLKVMQRKIGSAIASLTQNEAAYVSCGAASGITLAIAACMAGTDPIMSERLPKSDGMKNEVIMHACDQGHKCDVAIRNAGASIVHVGNDSGATEHEFRSAINERTAAIFDVIQNHPGKMPLEQMIIIARERGVPILVDAAFSVPPKENLWKYSRDKGADAVFISGGKGLGGPQCTGLVLGKTWIVEACAFHGAPNVRIGRGMKVGKEELAGIYAAVKLTIEQDQTSAQETRVRQLDHILACLEDVSNVAVRRLGATKAIITFDSIVYGLTYTSACQWLLKSVPAVYLEPSRDGLILSTECLEVGDEQIVGGQLRKLFRVG